MRKLLIVVLVLAFASPVEAARRWFVQTSDNKIVSFTDDDNAPTPAGTIAVADAVIRTEDPPARPATLLPLALGTARPTRRLRVAALWFPTIPRPIRAWSKILATP